MQLIQYWMKMDKFKQKLLQTKRVSVWGIGYLGYTTVLKLQAEGFFADVYDFTTERLNGLADGSYPTKEQRNTWTKHTQIPKIDLDRASIVVDSDLLFNNNVHIVSSPLLKQENSSTLNNLLKVLIKNKNFMKDSLIVFQSAGVPRTIEKQFIDALKIEGIVANIVSIFRSDWNIEDFLHSGKKRFIAGNSTQAVSMGIVFTEALHLNSIVLNSIVEAEVFENAKNSLEFTMTAFFNQLSLAYPDIDISTMSQKLLNQLSVEDISMGVSSIDYQSEQSIEHLLEGARLDYLGVIKEARSSNLSLLLYYADVLKNSGIGSVTIFGLSSYNSLKDLRFSPSLMLAEYLLKSGVKVSIHDSNFTKEEILQNLSKCTVIDLNDSNVTTDAVIVMSMSEEYKYYTQEYLDKIGFTSTKIIIDNTNLFKDFLYDNKTLYHKIGDGNLSKLI